MTDLSGEEVEDLLKVLTDNSYESSSARYITHKFAEVCRGLLAAKDVQEERDALKREVERLRAVVARAINRLQKEAYGAECSTQRRLNTLAILEHALTPQPDQPKGTDHV